MLYTEWTNANSEIHKHFMTQSCIKIPLKSDSMNESTLPQHIIAIKKALMFSNIRAKIIS